MTKHYCDRCGAECACLDTTITYPGNGIHGDTYVFCVKCQKEFLTAVKNFVGRIGEFKEEV